jgi:hypothetical protein
MTEVIVPAWSNQIARTLTNLYDDGGQGAIFDYVREHHKDWDWRYCLPCESDSPVFKVEGEKICAVCFTVFEKFYFQIGTSYHEV